MNELKPEDVMRAQTKIANIIARQERNYRNPNIAFMTTATKSAQAIYDALLREKDAEIERLKKENNQFADIGKMYSEIRAEAIDDFAEMLKSKKCHYTETEHTFDFDGVTVEDIEQTAKEMKGATDGKIDL